VSTEEEVDAIGAAVMQAGSVVSSAFEKHATGRWAYLVVAVPPYEPTASVVTLLMKSSESAEQMADFLQYIQVAYVRSFERGMVIDDRKPDERPS